MSVYDTYKRKFGTPNYSGNNFMTEGELLKHTSDVVMEDTWWNDPQSKVAYIYDYYHDDQPDICYGMTYYNTTKTKIDIKFIVTNYGSFSKDQPEAKIMFRPSQKTYFEPNDELYYLEQRRMKYGNMENFVGCYLDFPDEKGVYRKWMIVAQDIQGNQFPKYLVMPCNFNVPWIRKEYDKRIKQKMWGVLRSQSSYNSGLWRDRVFETRENQELLFLPTNEISDSIWYISEDNKDNQRLIVDLPTEHPNVWQVSKVERINVRGRTKITLYQTEADPHRDYIEKDEDGNIIGMWADYFAYDVEPQESEIIHDSKIKLLFSSATSMLKVGGSYKTITVITDNDTEISSAEFNAYVDDVLLDDTIITWRETDVPNKIKIKFADDRSYLDKIIKIECIADCNGETVVGAQEYDLSI